MLDAGCSRCPPSSPSAVSPAPPESGLRAGSCDRKPRPVDDELAAVALGRRPDEREPEPGASGGARRRGPARSGRSPPRRDAAGSPRPSPSPRARRSPAPTRPSTRTGPPGGPWRWAFSTRFRSARSSAPRSPRTSRGPVGLDDDAGLAVGRLPRRLCDVDRLVRHGAGVLAGESQEIVEEPAQPLGVGVDVGQRLGVGAVGKQVGRVPAQRGDRVSQLVRGVGDEPPLGLSRPLERGEHAGSASRRAGRPPRRRGGRPPAGGAMRRSSARSRRRRRRAARAGASARRARTSESGNAQRRRQERAADDQPPRLVERVARRRPSTRPR